MKYDIIIAGDFELAVKTEQEMENFVHSNFRPKNHKEKISLKISQCRGFVIFQLKYFNYKTLKFFSICDTSVEGWRAYYYSFDNYWFKDNSNQLFLGRISRKQ